MVRVAVVMFALLLAPAESPWVLGQRKLVLQPPGGYELLSATPDGSRLSCRTAGGATLVSLEVSRAGSSSDAGKKVIESLLGKLRREGKAMDAEVIAPAAAVEDPKLLAKVIDTIEVDGRRSSRARAVRVVAGWWIEMYAVATDPSDGKREEMLTAAEERILLAIRPATTVAGAGDGSDRGGKGPEAVRLSKARLAYIPPAGWVAQAFDGEEGVVAVWTQVGRPSAKLVLTRVPVAGEATEELLAAAVERAREYEEDVLKLPEPVSGLQKVQDGRFYTRARRVAGAGAGGSQVVTDSRTRRLGDAVVSVAMVTSADQEAEVAKVADELALGLTVR